MRGWSVVYFLSVPWLLSCSKEASSPEQTGLAIGPTVDAGRDDSSPVSGDRGVGGSSGFEPSMGMDSAYEDPEGNPDPTGLVGQAGTNGESAPGGSGPDASAPAGSGARCPAGPFPNSPLPGGVAPQPQVICSGMSFTEGAVWFADRNTLFFSDFQINNPAVGRIMSLVPEGQCQEFIATAGTNGLVIAPDGNLLGARHSDQTLTIFDLTSQQPSVLVADNAGVSFNSPNDIAVRTDGNIYFTDPTFLLGNRPSEQPAATYRRDPSGVLSIIDTGVNPNGISLSPDERRLYVAHLGGAGNVLAFDVDSDGSVSNPQTLINQGSDGMAVDCAGNLYLTQNGVRIFSQDGVSLGTIAAAGAANVAFGGRDLRTLFITAGNSLLAVDLAIPGLPY